MERLGVLFFSALLFLGGSLRAQTGSISGYITCSDSSPCGDAMIMLEHSGIYSEPDERGFFSLANIPYGNYNLIAFAYGYQTYMQAIRIDSSTQTISIQLTALARQFDPVVVQFERARSLGISRKKNVEGANLYAGKKTEVVQLSDIQANLSTNNARQVFGKITGLTIWESDVAGLQLGVGGRGLSPNRTANFNTRQNGYDISADALGYPEAYYTPPMEALERIEVLRGAASLQYGTQFGGMLNFVTKQGPSDKRFEVSSRQTLGSYGYFGSFTSLGGTLDRGRFNHYSYIQYKRGNSWRENSGFEAVTGSVRLNCQVSKKWQHQVEYTGMNYLAQQAGGLTDAAFKEDPRQSFRSRNWFQVNWNLAAWQVQYRPDSVNLIEMRVFGLLADRSSLGNLERINRMDLGGNRNLIQGEFANIGQEIRWLRTFTWLGKPQFNLLGYRIYSGHSKARQGDGNDGNGADFYFLHPDDLENSDYRFSNTNLALFWEQVIQLSTRLTVSPGVRAEYIRTAASGYYKLRVFDAAGNLVVDEKIRDARDRDRSFVIAGIGGQYKLSSKVEVYANISQNYRAINYTDLRISNPGFRVDSNLRDEHGFTADLGIRGEKAGLFIYELTGFYLKYNGRIGQVLRAGESPLYLDYRFRTNVADSRTYGVEAMGELNLFRLLKKRSLRFQDLNLFVNMAFTDARYLAPEQKAIDQKQVEMVPGMLLRSGLRYRWKYFRSSLNYSYTASHFSDATNSEWTSSAVEGRIPAYAVLDFSAGLKKGKWSVDLSVNNVLNTKYFTRRADSYPGPGIIPAEARAVYLTLGLTLGK